MGFFDSFKNIFGGGSADADSGVGKTVEQLAEWLGVELDKLRAIKPSYNTFTIPKRSGGKRKITAPSAELKVIQRKILRRLLGGLNSHPSATGFEKGKSIVDNARLHCSKAVVVRMDIKDYFRTTTAKRVLMYFQRLGWNNEAAKLLVNLCTYKGSLPQGAPTSPKLSNLVNYPIDARLSELAKRCHADYTRYADDITFSFEQDSRKHIGWCIRVTKLVVKEYGYKLHQKKKLRIMRQHQRQQVTGLVVNSYVQLPRQTRRKLRAIQHRIQNGKQATITQEQLAGWDALQYMIYNQQ